MPRYDDYDAFYKMKQASVLAQLNPARRTLPFASVEDGGYLRVRNGGNIVVEPGGYVDASKGTIDFEDSTIEGAWLDYVFAYQNFSFHGTAAKSGMDIFPALVMRWHINAPSWAAYGNANVVVAGTTSERGLVQLNFGIVEDSFYGDTRKQDTPKFGNESNYSFNVSASFGLAPKDGSDIGLFFNNSNYGSDRTAKIEAWAQGQVTWYGGDLS